MTILDYGLFDVLDDPVVVSDGRDMIVYANRAAERLLGWPAGAMAGEPLVSLMPARMRGAHETGFHRFMSTGKPRIIGKPVRVPAQRRDGVEIDVELTLSILRQGADGPEIVALLRDLRERVELERQIRISRTMRAATEAAAALNAVVELRQVVEAGVHAMVTGFGAALARLWVHESQTATLVLAASAGLSTQTVSSKRARLDLATYPYKVGVVARTREPFVTNAVAGDPQFDQAWVAREHISAVACFPMLVGGELEGVLAAFFRDELEPDVIGAIEAVAAMVANGMDRAQLFEREQSSRRRLAILSNASATLQESLDYEKTLRTVVALTMPTLGDFGFFELSEPRGVRRIAYAHEDPRRQAILERTHWVRSDRSDKNLCALSSGSTGVHSDIDEAWLQDVATGPDHLQVLKDLDFTSMLTVPLRYDQRVLGALTLFYARASRRRYTDDDVALAEELARRAASAVENARLFSETQQAVQLREDFLAIASHELRTPLTTLKLHSDGLLRAAAQGRTQMPPVTLEKAQRIQDQVLRMNDLIERLLDVTRFTHGAPELVRAPMNLGELVDEVLARLRAQLDGAGCTVDVLSEPNIVGNWDRSRLDQVVTNLITNALKYGAGHPVNIRVRADEGRASVRVTDHGIGIALEDQDRIFERFARAVPGPHYGGLGLGLWIARRIAASHGGTITVCSAPGAGSTFTVELPLAG